MHSDFKRVPKRLFALDKNHAQEIQTEFTALIGDKPDLPAELITFLSVAFDLSPYLKNSGFKEFHFILSMIDDGFEKTFEHLLENAQELAQKASDEAAFMQSIRICKRRVALLCGLADLGGWWNADQATTALSRFAKASLSASLDFVLLENHHSEKLVLAHVDTPQQDSGFIILGMGKLGAGELNYSSDIDLIFVFDDAAAIKLNTQDPISLLSRMAKKLIKLMQERTEDGYVFRMDLRLRPDPSSTPLVIPIVAALNYYEGQGQNWERAAMIKAKPVAGDLEAGLSFLKELEPFIWRKYLDFAAINDVQSIKRQIHAHKGHGTIAVLGHNVKLGRGGIREIEFFAQTQQLIAGGRNPELRNNETIAALNALYENNWIEEEALNNLTKAYWDLRDIEHRIQMVDDSQTHIMPDTSQGLARIANMFGEPDVDKFSDLVHQTLKTVEQYYSELFENADEPGSFQGNLVFTGDGEDPDTMLSLTQMGYVRTKDIINIIKSWHVAKMPALRATQARELLTELVPELLQAFSTASNPDEVLFTFDRFISGLPAGIQLFAILKSNPSLFTLMIKVLNVAPRLASQISQRPHVFDAMIDPQFGEGEIEKVALTQILNSTLCIAPDYEAKLNEARRFFHQTRFMIGCQCLAGTLSIAKTAHAFSTLAEVMIEVMLTVVKDEFSQKHGTIKGEKFCVLGMGRLGSRELTATSDLDLIFLYDFDDDVEYSDGEKQLPVSLYFIRFMQRFIAAMSSPTAEGKLFELDFRLRPSGNAGPLATHVDAFIKYQNEEAWVWETQSLTRARPVAGNVELCDQIKKSIPEILAQKSKLPGLNKEILDMRKRIEKEKGSADIWNVKTVSGGLLDIEFIAQYLAIKNGSNGQTGTLEILSDLKHVDLSAEQRDCLVNALDMFGSLINLQRICVGDSLDIKQVPAGFVQILCSSMDMPDIAAAQANLKQTQANVRSVFNSVLKPKKNPKP